MELWTDQREIKYKYRECIYDTKCSKYYRLGVRYSSHVWIHLYALGKTTAWAKQAAEPPLTCGHCGAPHYSEKHSTICYLQSGIYRNVMGVMEGSPFSISAQWTEHKVIKPLYNVKLYSNHTSSMLPLTNMVQCMLLLRAQWGLDGLLLSRPWVLFHIPCSSAPPPPVHNSPSM